MFPDPLRINYIVVLADDRLEETSPFQGFGRSWPGLIWALELLAQLPADVLEPAQFGAGLIAQRMGGMRQLLWSPLSVSPLERLGVEDFGPFLVVMSGDPETSERVGRWTSALGVPVLHVSAMGVASSVAAGDFTSDVLKDYCGRVMAERGAELSAPRRAAVEESLVKWEEPRSEAVGLKAWMHNVTMPNQMVLARARRHATDPESFHGRSEAEYTGVIADGVRAVEAVRTEVGFRDFHRMSLIHPALYVVEPAFYRHAYARFRRDGAPDRAAFDMLRLMQTQRGLFNEVDGKLGQAIVESAAAKQVVAVRGQDLAIFTAAVGLKAAQTTSAVMRLSPGVNHVFPLLSNFARNIRATSPAARLKTPRLFGMIQDQLAGTLGPERMALIGEVGGPIKIVSDAPLELLPVDGLPLMFRYLCSRVCATPGNVLMLQLAQNEAITVTPQALRKVLVVSSFEADDPLRDVLIGAVGRGAPGWLGKVEVVVRRVSSRSELVDTLNASEAPIMIFDGHGRGNADTGIATLRIGKEDVDVWHLRGEARIPPIVILSACDTQGIDASSHATVGTGFLAAGAQTVLATLLPVDGRASAAFVARLIYRLADFIPAALKARRRVLNWTEVISGMQQMLLASELLDVLVGPITAGSARERLQTEANVHINGGDGGWYEWLHDAIAAHRREKPEQIARRAHAIVARSEAIRYVQLGNPENILIDDGSIEDQIIPPELRALIMAEGTHAASP